jgi:hypothetical protein
VTVGLIAPQGGAARLVALDQRVAAVAAADEAPAQARAAGGDLGGVERQALLGPEAAALVAQAEVVATGPERGGDADEPDGDGQGPAGATHGRHGSKVGRGIVRACAGF